MAKNKAEEVLLARLDETESVETLARIGLEPDCIPTEQMRQVVGWVLDRYFESKRTSAPSKEAIYEVWRQEIEDAECVVGSEMESEDTMEWAIGWLKEQYIYKASQDLGKDMARAIAESPRTQFLATFTEHAQRMMSAAQRMESHETGMVLSDGFERSVALYEGRHGRGTVHEGLTFGLPQIDNWTYGVHTGELAVLGAGPKVGKSYFSVAVGLNEWRQGRECCLFTLENSIEMTIDRMVCALAGVDSRAYQRGQLSADELDRVIETRDGIAKEVLADLHILQPEPGMRTVQAMLRRAASLGAKSIILDQLTFIEPEDVKAPRNLQIREVMQGIKRGVSSGSHPMACLLNHQINRPGVEAARALGRLRMEHFAEGADVERTVDWGFGLYQGDEDRNLGSAIFQILAARREDNNAWRLNWQPARSIVAVEGVEVFSS